MPTPGLLMLMANAQIGQNIDPDEVLRYFSWTVFAAIAVGYTAYVFWMKLANNAPFILSNRNERPWHLVLIWHASFWLILFCGYCFYTALVPHLPFWMTNTFRHRGSRWSFADFVWLAAMFVMAYFERKWLYRERTAVGEGLEEAAE